MHPLLINLGPIPIHTYGFMIALGFLSAVWLAKVLGRRSRMDEEKLLDLAFWCLITGFLGARIVFIITRWGDFAADPISVFKVWQGGLVFYGGPLLAVPAAVWFVHRHQMNVWKTMDIAMPCLTIAHMFGRFGCLSAGCCYGRPTDKPWGIRLYSELVDAPLRGIPLHPTQLYEALSLGILFAGLMWIFKHKKFDGQVGLTYFMVYPVIRSIVEIYRGDLIRGFVIDGWLSTSQFISIFVFALATATLIYRLKSLHRQPAGAPA